MAFPDYSSDPDANTTIGDSVYIGPNMARDDVREALQTLAADGRLLADDVDALADVITATGEFYDSLAAGEAATTAGETFAVATGDGTYTWYRRTGGGSTELFHYPHSGATTLAGDSTAIFRITNADGTANLNIHNVAPYVSVSGTRTSKAPRIVLGAGSDAGYDAAVTSACAVTGTLLFRDTFQAQESFSSLNGAQCDFDAFTKFTGAVAMNHKRHFQARGQIEMTGGVLLSEWTGHFTQPIFNGTFNVDQLIGSWYRDAQVVSGTQNIFNAYAIKIDTLTTGWGANVFGIYNEEKSYFAKELHMGTTADVYGGREVRANAIHAVGSINAFQASGGVAVYAPGGGAAAIIRAYSNNSGATNPLAVQPTGGVVIVGATTGTTGKTVEITGSTSVTAGYFYNSNQVVGARNTGWTAMTGTGSKGALAAAAAGTASGAYVQAELQGALNRIAALEARLKAYDDAWFAHGLIGA